MAINPFAASGDETNSAVTSIRVASGAAGASGGAIGEAVAVAGLERPIEIVIPIYTPFTMMNRAAGPPETWEYIVTSALLLVTIWFTFKAAGKVFRVGVLMTGNPPKLKEILGWLWKS